MIVGKGEPELIGIGPRRCRRGVGAVLRFKVEGRGGRERRRVGSVGEDPHVFVRTAAQWKLFKGGKIGERFGSRNIVKEARCRNVGRDAGYGATLFEWRRRVDSRNQKGVGAFLPKNGRRHVVAQGGKEVVNGLDGRASFIAARIRLRRQEDGALMIGRKIVAHGEGVKRLAADAGDFWSRRKRIAVANMDKAGGEGFGRDAAVRIARREGWRVKNLEKQMRGKMPRKTLDGIDLPIGAEAKENPSAVVDGIVGIEANKGADRVHWMSPNIAKSVAQRPVPGDGHAGSRTKRVGAAERPAAPQAAGGEAHKAAASYRRDR